MRSRASSLIMARSLFTREDTYLNTPIKREMVHFSINKMHEKRQMATDFDYSFGEWSEFQLTVVGGW